MNGPPALAVGVLRRAGWAPMAVLMAHGGLLLVDGYDRYPDVDLVMHFAGGLAIGRLTAGVLDVGREAGAVRLAPRGLELLLIVACTALAAVLWEVCELALDAAAGTRQLGDTVDTVLDLLVGLLGGAVYALARRSGLRVSP